jgi:hypothetical protein
MSTFKKAEGFLKAEILQFCFGTYWTESENAFASGVWSFARKVGSTVCLILIATTVPGTTHAGAYTASGRVVQEFYPAGPPGVSDEGPNSATYTQTFTEVDLVAISSATATAGNLSMFAQASINNMTQWSSGHVGAAAWGKIEESVAPSWAESLLKPGESLILEYEILVGGELQAGKSGTAAFDSGADLTYTYAIGGSSGGGNWYQGSDGNTYQSGVWNAVISESLTIYADSSFLLELYALANTGASKGYNPESNATSIAIADFSHTLTWLGITNARAFDSDGNEFALPDDFRIPLIGQESGFDYWNSAAAPAEIPEPATSLLFGIGIAAAGLKMKSIARRRNS